MNRSRLLCVLVLMAIPLTATASSSNPCVSAEVAQAAAAKHTLPGIQAEKPEVNNPYDRAVRGTQCVNSEGSYEQILQLIESMPIGSQGEQILQTIMQLFGNTQNSCNPYVTQQQTSTPQGGSFPTATAVSNAPLPVTQYNNGNKTGASSMYQSIFPGA